MKQIYRQCAASPIAILYFYSSKRDCPDCTKQGYVLTQLREDHPELRVYAFDYDLDSDAIKTLISIYHIAPNLPALIIDEQIYPGFKSISDIEKILPALAVPEATTTPATASSTLRK